MATLLHLALPRFLSLSTFNTPLIGYNSFSIFLFLIFWLHILSDCYAFPSCWEGICMCACPPSSRKSVIRLMKFNFYSCFSLNRPTGPIWSSSCDVCVSVCLSVPFPCNFFKVLKSKGLDVECGFLLIILNSHIPHLNHFDLNTLKKSHGTGTDRHTDTQTSQLLERIGPVG